MQINWISPVNSSTPYPNTQCMLHLPVYPPRTTQFCEYILIFQFPKTIWNRSLHLWNLLLHMVVILLNYQPKQWTIQWKSLNITSLHCFCIPPTWVPFNQRCFNFTQLAVYIAYIPGIAFYGGQQKIPYHLLPEPE